MTIIKHRHTHTEKELHAHSHTLVIDKCTCSLKYSTGTQTHRHTDTHTHTHTHTHSLAYVSPKKNKYEVRHRQQNGRLVLELKEPVGPHAVAQYAPVIVVIEAGLWTQYNVEVDNKSH